MSNSPYPPETLGSDDDNGTMPENVATLAETVIGHRIVAAEQGEGKNSKKNTGQIAHETRRR